MNDASSSPQLPLLHLQQLDHAGLDALAQQLADYKDRTSTKRTHDHHGASFPLAQRKQQLISMTEQLVALAPPVATEQSRALQKKLADLRQVHEQLPDTNPYGHVRELSCIINNLPQDIAAMHTRALPKRRGHPEEQRYLIVKESQKHLNFLRHFVGAHDADAEQYGSAFTTAFSHLSAYRNHAVQVLRLCQLTARINDIVAPYRSVDGTTDFVADRMKITEDLEGIATQFLQDFPSIFCHTTRQGNFYANVRYAVLTLAKTAREDRPVHGVEGALTELRYQACHEAQYAFENICSSYAKDCDRGTSKLWPASAMLNDVYHARWSLMADAVQELIKSNAKTLKNSKIGFEDPSAHRT